MQGARGEAGLDPCLSPAAKGASWPSRGVVGPAQGRVGRRWDAGLWVEAVHELCQSSLTWACQVWARLAREGHVQGVWQGATGGMSNSLRRNGFHGMLPLPAFCDCPGFVRQTTLSGHHISCSLTRPPSPVLFRSLPSGDDHPGAGRYRHRHRRHLAVH